MPLREAFAELMDRRRGTSRGYDFEAMLVIAICVALRGEEGCVRRHDGIGTTDRSKFDIGGNQLDTLDLKRCLVGHGRPRHQTKIAAKIIALGRDYVLAAEDNQKNLSEAIADLWRPPAPDVS